MSVLKKKVEIGDTVFVARQEMYYKVDANLTEYLVVKANKSSFYAHPVGRPMTYPVRFSQKNMGRRDMGQILEVHLSEKAYWDLIRERQELAALRNEMIKRIKEIDVVKLRQVAKLINRKYITDKQIDKVTKVRDTDETEPVRN